MSISLQGKKTKTTTSSTSNANTNTASNSTTTPLAPQWASDLTQRLAGRVSGLSEVNPYGLVAPTHALQTQAAGAAGALTGSPWNYDAAADATRHAMAATAPSTAGVKASGYINDYLNPYLTQVVDATGADLDASAGRVRAQQALDLAGAGAFGGSGAALTRSMTEGELARARASSLAALRSQGYETALGAAQQDAARAQSANDLNAQLYAGQMDRALSAANQLGALSSGFDANQRANIATQAGLGETLRGIDQEQRQAPVASTQQLVAMLSGLPIQLFTGSQTSGSTNSTTDESSTGKSKTTEFGGSITGRIPGLPPGMYG